MTAVLANSRRVAADLLGEGCARDRIGLIYNGTDLAAFAAPVDRARVRAGLDVPAGGLLLVKVANLIPYKGHSDLLQALALAAPRLTRPVVVALAGRDDGIGDALVEEARTLGVLDQVRFLGLRRDVPDILKAADVGLLVSHEEGFSNAVIEGMAAGLPMLVTDVGGNAEAVVHGECGLVVPPRAPDRLAEALIRLAADDGLCARMGAAARSRAERHYALPACVDRYEALYLGLAAGRAPGTISEVAID
jgi:glycosyltransferase involved in cell wall biosynthesis